VLVSDNRFTHEQSGGASERWSTSRTLQLSPLRLVSEGSRSFHAATPDKESGDYFDYEELSGEVVRAAPECAPGEPSLGARTLPYLPQVQVEPSYLQGGWKQAGLGSCALVAPHFLLGSQDDPKDAALKALLVAPDTLLVEVRDDRWTGPGAKWLNDDHVELWLGPQPPEESTGCGKPAPTQRPVQWAVRVTDGQVFPAHGTPKAKLEVERAEISGPKGVVGYRLKVTLPTPFGGVAVVYSDSDAGKKQELMLATSLVQFARAGTLNPVRVVPPEVATCAVRKGELAVVPGPPRQVSPEQAVLGQP
jgi:hypothetical protein